MAKVVLDFGTTVDMLNKSELQEALAEDARLRSIVAGVKAAEYWANLGTIGANQATFTTPVNLIGAGYAWAVMAAGLEPSVAGGVKVIKQNYTGSINGGNRVVGQLNNVASVSYATWSKGQLILRAGDVLTFAPASGNVLSLWLAAIEIPAERIGELLL